MARAPRADPHTRRTQILVAAHRLFSRRGFHDTSMQDIADEVGLSVGALYRYFDGKEALVRGLAEWGRDQKRGLLNELTPGGGGEVLGRVLAEILGFLDSEGAEQAAWLDVHLWGAAAGAPSLREVLTESLDGIREPLASYLHAERREGRIRADVDPEPTARLLVAVLLGLELQKALEPQVEVAPCARALVGFLQRLAPEVSRPPSA